MIHDDQSSDIMATNTESVEVAVTVNFLRGTEPAEFDKLKGKVLQNLNEMIASVTNVLCNQPLEFDTKKFVHSNQNTVKQPTFFSTKRKPRNLKLCMAKSTEEEKSKYKHDENV